MTTAPDIYDDLNEMIVILDELKDEDMIVYSVPSESFRRDLKNMRKKLLRMQRDFVTGGT